MKTISLVAGPCSAESRTQMLETARGLKEIGVGTLRAGLWKPRSRCGTFEGVGEEGLDWNVFILIFLNCLSTVIRAISEENVNYWRLFAGKPYLCTLTVCLSSRIAVRRKLFLMLPSN